MLRIAAQVANTDDEAQKLFTLIESYRVQYAKRRSLMEELDKV
ncbi:MAG: hypothetical protein SH857_08465 [Chitinophagales bacterium]|nr:hypothetical protein [Chitinophagales bacterium]